jgi:hypothetical protein
VALPPIKKLNSAGETFPRAPSNWVAATVTLRGGVTTGGVLDEVRTTTTGISVTAMLLTSI